MHRANSFRELGSSSSIDGRSWMASDARGNVPQLPPMVTSGSLRRTHSVDSASSCGSLTDGLAWEERAHAAPSRDVMRQARVANQDVTTPSWWLTFLMVLVGFGAIAFFLQAYYNTGSVRGLPHGGVLISRALPDSRGSRQQPLNVHAADHPFGVCIVSADFWGLPSAGGTATAFHLLAQALAEDERYSVLFLGASKRFSECQELTLKHTHRRLKFECLRPQHFTPEVVETYPYEQLSHAVLAWADENLHRCDAIHVHEWGGVALALATIASYHQMKPGLQVILQAHGGHFWSTQGQKQEQEIDVTALRIDHAERMTLMLADVCISPTHYMIAFFRQRGWQLPLELYDPQIMLRLMTWLMPVIEVIPNILPRTLGIPEPTVRPVWRVAFYSRLEERKGLRLFVEAMGQLDYSHLNDRFEVDFIGSEASIEGQSSMQWIKAHTDGWPIPSHVQMNVERSQALQKLNKNGTLLIFCSSVENMPYVIAEAMVIGIPVLVTDVGGILEIMNATVAPENIMQPATPSILAQKVQEIMHQGNISTMKLTDNMLHGRDRWLAWHRRLAIQTLSRVQADIDLSRALHASHMPFKIHHLTDQDSMQLYRSVCKSADIADSSQLQRGQAADTIVKSKGPVSSHAQTTLLLLPSQYQVLEPAFSHEFTTLLQAGHLLTNGIGALTFGVQLPDNKIAYPRAPTWILYTGSDDYCLENVPIVIQKETFCRAFVADARIFPEYSTWLLSLLLTQIGMRLHTYLRPAFRLVNVTADNSNCRPDQVPERRLPFSTAIDLLNDAEQMMRTMHVVPVPQPATSLIQDFPKEQGHKGWQIGFQPVNTSAFHPLVYQDDGNKTLGRWQCSNASMPYPVMQSSLAHPCVQDSTTCCGFAAVDLVMRFQSFFASQHSGIVLEYEVWPVCGDGLDVELHLNSGGQRHMLMRNEHEPGQHEKPQRHHLHQHVALHSNDVMDLIIQPRSNHACDQVFLIAFEVWQEDGPSHRLQSSDHTHRRSKAGVHNTSK